MTSCTLKDIECGHKTSFKSFNLKIEDELAISSEKQQMIPIMGESGAGKSTLLNIIAKISQPYQGNISWSFSDDQKFFWGHNQKLKYAQTNQLRRKYFGYLFQDSTLSPFLTIKDNLLYPLYANGKKGKSALNKIDDLIKQMLPEYKDNIDKLTSSYPAQISGGQRQRVALIQALVNDPKVLFADEPAASLDAQTRKTIMEALHQWVEKDKQRLFIWVTHHEDDKKIYAIKQYLKSEYINDDKTEAAIKWEMVGS